MTLGESKSLFLIQFSHLYKEDANINNLISLKIVIGVRDIIPVKSLE